MNAVGKVDLPFKLFRRGKVRDVFDLGQELLIVSTDRISAFDFVLPSLIPGKGQVISKLSDFFFHLTRELIPNHIVSGEPEKMERFAPYFPLLEKRTVLARKMRAFPVEAIVRGYIVGSGWKSYEKSGEICGVTLPAGLKFADRFPEPIFTPSTKADAGHDENITMQEMQNRIGKENAGRIEDLSLTLFSRVSKYAAEKGIIVADGKFEFGQDEDGKIVLIDEIFTPDSSRFWKLSEYIPGKEPPSYDKQFVRNFLLASAWDRQSVPPELPADIVSKTAELYREIYRLLTGNPL